jgi:hypothetical protein
VKIDPYEVLGHLVEATHRLLAQEELVYSNPGEQNLSIELAAHLKPLFHEWHVHGEYDKREQDEKWLAYADEDGVLVATKIRPDIIVHHVGKRENLLVIEMKRDVNKARANDVRKLKGLTRQDGDYGYELGVHLVVDIPTSRVTLCDVYRDGAINAELTAWIRQRLPAQSAPPVG